MRISVTRAPWLLLLLASLPAMQGCDHKAQQQAQSQTLAPPIVDAPPPKPATVSTADLPPPVVGNPQPAPPTTPATDSKPATPPKKPAHPKKTTPPATTTAQPTQEASNTSNAAPSVSAIGELTSGDSGTLRSQTEDSINATEKGVNSINRSLNDSELKTVAQIREFLKQARDALATGDVDGASTLAKKAKVLLAELNQ